MSDILPDTTTGTGIDALVNTISRVDDVDGLTEQLTALPFIDRVTYQTENGIDTTPAIITIHPADDATTEQLELVGAISQLVVIELKNEIVKASVEHPLERVVEDGEVVDLAVNEDKWTVSIRWNKRMATTPSDVRYEGYAITPDVIGDIDPSALSSE